MGTRGRAAWNTCLHAICANTNGSVLADTPPLPPRHSRCPVRCIIWQYAKPATDPDTLDRDFTLRSHVVLRRRPRDLLVLWLYFGAGFPIVILLGGTWLLFFERSSHNLAAVFTATYVERDDGA